MTLDPQTRGHLDATPAAGFACADLTTFCRLDELGLKVTGQRLDRTVQSWRAGSLSPTAGVVGVDAKALRVIR